MVESLEDSNECSVKFVFYLKMSEEEQLLTNPYKRKKYKLLWYSPVLLLLLAVTILVPMFSFSVSLPLLGRWFWFSSSPEFSFMVVGDWGREGHHHQKRVASAMAVLARYVKPRFIISTGDNFYEDGVASARDKQWNISFENVYSYRMLENIPWYAVLGNHDHLGNYTAQVDYSNKSERWNMPRPFFSIPVNSYFGEQYLFVFLDTTPFIKDSYGEVARKNGKQSWRLQLSWLEKLLNSSSSRRIFVIGHHNMYSSSIAGERGREELRILLKPILDKYSSRITAYVSGHEHSLQHLQPYGVSGIDHFISGGGSKTDNLKDPPKDAEQYWYDCCKVLPFGVQDKDKPRSLFRASTHGFFIFKVYGNEIVAEAYSQKAKLLYQYHKSLR
ncbi:acid phosphatase [Galdieria sulphuraria]|uniref:Acid phosphatase n=1 Tax=Galdieria sulphuraria TaxID=130081 RepID=M2XD28_GALSU|nr:acid phosphatase [Galdieria sulphuraria]EME27847.1 acid phosphatase [Galdieria sulphuraria]|eukprot:XP_005704367.1 acid phosphatase [Galdieria sulphuraria]